MIYRKLLAFFPALSIVLTSFAPAPQEIAFSDIDGVRVGNCQDNNAGTGVTVFLFPDKAVAAELVEKAVKDAVVSSAISDTEFLANVK